MSNGTQNTIELVLRARDEASKQVGALNQQLAQTQQAGTRAGEGLARMGAQTVVTTRSISAMATTTRFAAVSVVSQFNPALGASVSQMASMASVAGALGTALGPIGLVVAVTLAIGAIGQYIRKSREARQEQEAFTKAVRAFDTSALADALKKAEDRFDRLRNSVILTQRAFGPGQVAPDESPEVRERQRALERAREIERLGREREILGGRQQLFATALEGQPSTLETVDYRERALGETAERDAELQRQRLGLQEQSLVTEEENEHKRQTIRADFAHKREVLELEHQTRLTQISQKGEEDRKRILDEAEGKAIAARDEDLAADRATQQKLEQRRTQIASQLIALREEFGEEGLRGAIEALGPAIDENVIKKMKEIEDPALRSLRVVREQFRETQRAAQEFARDTASFISSTLFDALEGRIQRFDDALKRFAINFAKVRFERILFEGLPQGGGGGFFNFGSGGGPASAGVAGMGALFPTAAAAGSSVTGLSGTVTAVAPGSALSAATPGLAGSAGGAMGTLGGVGAFLGQVGAVVGPIFLGAGIGTMISGFMGGNQTGSMIGGLLGAGAGFLIGGPIGALIGGALGGVIGGLFGGGAKRRAEQRQRVLQQANAAIESAFGSLRGVDIQNPALRDVLEDLSRVAQLSDRISGRAEGFSAAFIAFNGVARAFASGSLDELQFLHRIRAAMFADPSGLRAGAAGTLGQLIQAGFFPEAPALTRLLRIGADALFREGRLRAFGPDLFGIQENLFEAQLADFGIRGITPLIEGGLLPPGIAATQMMMEGGVQRARITRSQVEAVENMSPEAMQALIFRFMETTRQMGISITGLEGVLL